MIKAAIFDMDGLLIDSEPLWREAEVDVFNSVGALVTSEMLNETFGLREDELISYWYKKFPWKDKATGEVEEEIKNRVLELIKEKGEPKKGVKSILDFLKNKNIKLAVASSSYLSFIETVVEKFGIKNYFDILYSGEIEKYGKPNPAIYLSTMDKLNVVPDESISFEDSLSGVLAAKSARLKCICVPEKSNKNNKKLAISDYILDSLDDFNEKIWKEINN